MSFNTLTLLRRCALATNFLTSVFVSQAPKLHAAMRRSFGLKALADSLAQELESIAGARSLPEARFQCLAGTYLRP